MNKKQLLVLIIMMFLFLLLSNYNTQRQNIVIRQKVCVTNVVTQTDTVTRLEYYLKPEIVKQTNIIIFSGFYNETIKRVIFSTNYVTENLTNWFNITNNHKIYTVIPNNQKDPFNIGPSDLDSDPSRYGNRIYEPPVSSP